MSIMNKVMMNKTKIMMMKRKLFIGRLKALRLRLYYQIKERVIKKMKRLRRRPKARCS